MICLQFLHALQIAFCLFVLIWFSVFGKPMTHLIKSKSKEKQNKQVRLMRYSMKMAERKRKIKSNETYVYSV